MHVSDATVRRAIHLSSPRSGSAERLTPNDSRNFSRSGFSSDRYGTLHLVRSLGLLELPERVDGGAKLLAWRALVPRPGNGESLRSPRYAVSLSLTLKKGPRVSRSELPTDIE
jgi:hypothetical protein